MIQIIAAVVVLSVLQSSASAHTPEWKSLSARICLEREENHGSINVVPSRVQIAATAPEAAPLYEVLLAGGGAAGCVLVGPGKYQLTVLAPEAYQRAPGPERCTSPPFVLSVAAGGTAELNVWPTAREDGYAPCGWEILPHGTAQSGHCMQSHRSAECDRQQQNAP